MDTLNKLETISFLHSIYVSLPTLSSVNSDNRYITASKYLNLYNLKLVTPIDLKGNDSISKFVHTVGPCLIYPLSISSVLLGFGFRSLQDKNFLIVSISSLYLYSSIRSLEYFQNNTFTYGTPIIFSEGIADSEFLASIYPLSFSYLTSGITDVLAQFISTITNNVIIASDNDKAGDFGFLQSSKLLSNYNVHSTRLEFPRQYKDPGDILDLVMSKNPTSDYLVNLIRSSIQLIVDSYKIHV